MAKKTSEPAKERKTKIPVCPQCGENPQGTVESVEVIANIFFYKYVKPDYSGESEVDWNSQKPILNAKTKRIQLWCRNCGQAYDAPARFKVG